MWKYEKVYKTTKKVSIFSDLQGLKSLVGGGGGT